MLPQPQPTSQATELLPPKHRMVLLPLEHTPSGFIVYRLTDDAIRDWPNPLGVVVMVNGLWFSYDADRVVPTEGFTDWVDALRDDIRRQNENEND